jgi:DNA-binding MarR family transcriptional regulator
LSVNRKSGKKSAKSAKSSSSGTEQAATSSSLEFNTGTLLLQVYQGFERRLIAALKERGHPDFRTKYGAVLANIDTDGTRLSTLADRAAMSRPSMVELIDELESKGYVRREPDLNDRRAKLIVPTEKGMDTISVAVEVIDSLEHRFCELLGEQQYQAMRRALGQLHAHCGHNLGSAQPRARLPRH